MTQQITPKQQLILDIIKEKIDKQGEPPSLRELQEILKISTKRGVVNHLKALEKKGLILRSSQARGIKLSENLYGQYIMDVKLLGYANAGTPLTYAEEQALGTLRIKKSLLPVTKEIFAVEVKGDSMNKREIMGTLLNNGNFAIIAKNQLISNGDVVLAIIDDCATLKTIKKDKKVTVLYPESSNKLHKPIYLDNEDRDVIYGKVIAVLDNPSKTV